MDFNVMKLRMVTYVKHRIASRVTAPPAAATATTILTPTIKRTMFLFSSALSSSQLSFLLVLLLLLIMALLLLLLYIILKRRWNKYILSSGKCNLPTVMWLPKFLNYHPIRDDGSNRTTTIDDGDGDDGDDREDTSSHQNQNEYHQSKQKMGPSSITNILPRMEKLCGPYGMYATVYGISTKVLHVAHPTPAKIILTGDCSYSNKNGNKSNNDISGGSAGKSSGNGLNNSSHKVKKRRSSSNKNGESGSSGGIAYSLGAIKNPAYDHFDNMFGSAVFTADGKEWKMKRTSVLHCLLRDNNTKNMSKTEECSHLHLHSRLEVEANLAADEFISSALYESNGASTSTSTSASANIQTNTKAVNIVTLLQRSTIGLIYRFLTHHDISASSYKNSVNSINNNNSSSSSSSRSRSSSLNYQHKNKCDDMKKDDDLNQEKEKDDDSTNSTTSSSSLISSTSLTPPPGVQTILSSNNTNTDKEHKEDISNPFEMLSSYLEAITNIRMIILAQSRSIWFLLPRWFYKLVSPMYREEEKQMKVIRQFARCACLNAVPGSPLHSLRSRKSHNNNIDDSGSRKTRKSRGSDGGNADDDDFVVNKDILDEAITLLFAGQDTSAATLSWTLHLLSLYPKVQERLAKEVCDALDKNETSNYDNYDISDNDNDNNTTMKRRRRLLQKTITKKMVLNLPYLDAVIKESMRLYPVAPFVVRRIPHDLTMPPDDYEHNNNAPTKNTKTNKGKDVTIPRDTLACIWIYGLHRNNRCWHRPHDFIPERWIDPALQELDAGQKNGSFMPFAAGPRNCVGQPLAHVVLRIVLAKVVHCCDFRDGRVDQYYERNRNRNRSRRNERIASSMTDEELMRATLPLRKDMQAGFTVLPTGGVYVNVVERKLEDSN